MLCLDMKLVSRLRNLSGTSNGNGNSNGDPPEQQLSVEEHLQQQQQATRRASGGTLSPASQADEQRDCSDDEAVPSIRIVRDRSRSVCMPVLTSSQLRHLHRRASHHVTCTDTVGRRGVLSRRYYGSVEMLPQMEQDGMDGRRFRVENGDSPGEKEEMFGSPSTPVLENPEYQTRWYFKYFLGKLHQNYVASDQEKNPLFLSVVISEAGDQCVPHYRLILWRRTGAQRISLPYSSNRSLSVRQILGNYFGIEKLDKAPREVVSADIQKDLLLLEEQEGSVNFKFGVMYAREGQRSDDEMLSNERGSAEFERFLEVLGDRIRLRGWDKYRGGLDVKGDMTGAESVYTVYAGHEVMYHVSTLLPHSKDDPQQLERKRHIGNDIVNIIYSEDGALLDSFEPASVRSQFTHVFALVTSDSSGWRMAIYCDESVPLFGPSLPCPPRFDDANHLREFLLVKLINGEKASFDTPTFSRKRERTLASLLRDMQQEHAHEGRPNSMLQRRALSDVVESGPGRRREDARAVQMVRVGQALKLEAIVHGLAPTSLATAAPLKPRPWQARCVCDELAREPVCGDAWADGRLIVATEAGTFVLHEGRPPRMVFDRSLQLRQLDLLEQQGVLLFRGAGKDCAVHVFRLGELEAAQARSRAQTKPRRLDRSKGAQLYCLSRATGPHLRMVVAAGRRLGVFQWRHSAAWTSWCGGGGGGGATDTDTDTDSDTVDGFRLVRELQASEPPALMSVLDSAAHGGWAVCCALKHHYELHFADAPSRSLAIEQLSKPRLVGALDLAGDQEPELLLCYNNTCHFQKLSDECAAPTEFDFNWNSVPSAVACAFPYVIAFTPDSMEIRLIVNGNLVHTIIGMPNLSLISCKHDIFFASSAAELPGSRLDEAAPAQSTAASGADSRSASTPTCGRGMRIYRIPLQTLQSRPSAGKAPGAAPSAANFLGIAEVQHRQLSRSCSSSPTPSLGLSFTSSFSSSSSK